MDVLFSHVNNRILLSAFLLQKEKENFISFGMCSLKKYCQRSLQKKVGNSSLRVVLAVICTSMSHNSKIVKPRSTTRNIAPGHIKSQIFWNF